MKSKFSNNKWSLRQIQIAAIIIITALFLIRILTPPLTKHARAEKLYQDAWFLKYKYLGEYDDAARGKVCRMFRKALAISPDNTLYQQAVAWNCPEAELKSLIDKGKLDSKALIIAYHRYYTYADNTAFDEALKSYYKSHPGKPKTNLPYNKETLLGSAYWQGKLDRIDKLAKIDPENAMVGYQRAYIYGTKGKQYEMLADVRRANSMRFIATGIPEVSHVVKNTMVDPVITAPFEGLSKNRELARQIVGYSNELLRLKKIPAALDASEEICRMGIKMTSTQPYTNINYLVANAVFAIGYRKLDSICRDFGRTGELTKYRSINELFELNAKKQTTNIANLMQMTRAFVIVQIFSAFIMISFACTMLFLMLWGIMAVIRYVKRKEKFNTKAWNEGWILRLLFSIYLPSILLIMIFGITQPNGYNGFMHSSIIMIAVSLIFAGIVAVKLRNSYDSSQEKQIGLLRFIFIMPIEVRTWICRSYTLFFGAQLVFILCLGMLVSQFSITRYRVLPWQIERMHLFRVDIESSTAKSYADEVNHLAVEKGIIKGK